MPTKKEEIRKAFDAFEEDDFLASKDILKKEIKDALSDYVKDKLELEKPLGGESDKGDSE